MSAGIVFPEEVIDLLLYLSKEVIRHQPEDIVSFLADVLVQLVGKRNSISVRGLQNLKKNKMSENKNVEIDNSIFKNSTQLPPGCENFETFLGKKTDFPSYSFYHYQS